MAKKPIDGSDDYVAPQGISTGRGGHTVGDWGGPKTKGGETGSSPKPQVKTSGEKFVFNPDAHGSNVFDPKGNKWEPLFVEMGGEADRQLEQDGDGDADPESPSILEGRTVSSGVQSSLFTTGDGRIVDGLEHLEPRGELQDQKREVNEDEGEES